jgi:hypothetical protein
MVAVIYRLTTRLAKTVSLPPDGGEVHTTTRPPDRQSTRDPEQGA